MLSPDEVQAQEQLVEEGVWEADTAMIKRFIQLELAGVDLNGSEGLPDLIEIAVKNIIDCNYTGSN